MILIIIAIILVFLYFKYFKKAKLRHDTISFYTGSNGSGKTLFAVKQVKKLYAKCMRKYKLKAFFFKLFKKKLPEKPLLISSIRLDFGKDLGKSTDLTMDILTNKKGLPHKSVVFIDEIGDWINQYEYDLRKHIDLQSKNDFLRFFRHTTQGGYLVATDQHIANVSWIFKRRAGKSYNLSGFRKYGLFGFYLAVTSVREILHSDDITTTVTVDKRSSGLTHDNAERKLYTFLTPFKNYDTYCYSNFRNDNLIKDNSNWNALKYEKSFFNND